MWFFTRTTPCAVSMIRTHDLLSCVGLTTTTLHYRLWSSIEYYHFVLAFMSLVLNILAPKWYKGVGCLKNSKSDKINAYLGPKWSQIKTSSTTKSFICRRALQLCIANIHYYKNDF
jgi:hypothetical protein